MEKVKEYNKQRSNYDPDDLGEESLTNTMQIIKDNHIELQDEIDEELPEQLDASPEARAPRAYDSIVSEIKDETEHTGKSAIGQRNIEEDIIPDYSEDPEPKFGTTEVTTEMLVNDIMESTI